MLTDRRLGEGATPGPGRAAVLAYKSCHCPQNTTIITYLSMIIWMLLVDSKFQALLESPVSVDVKPSSDIEQMKAKVIEQESGVNLPSATTRNLSVWKTRDDCNLNISLSNVEEILENNIDEVRNAIRRIAEDERVGDLGLVNEQVLLVRYVKRRGTSGILLPL